MERPALNDANEFPDDKVLARQFGAAKTAWDAFTALLAATTPPLAAEWRFYNDGRSWLCKVTAKAKTVCWVSAWKKFFKVSFYFTAKVEAAISQSTLDEAIKYTFLHPKGKCSLRPITTEVRKISDLKPIKELITIKLLAK
jgi:hypothetical protein